VTLYPLLGNSAPAGQNPVLSMLDANGNILIVTTFGTTGSSAPAAPANAAEGTTVTDGSVVWSVVSGTSQGFRLDTLPGASGPTYQVTPTYQIDPPKFTSAMQLLDPIPDSYSRYFYRGLESECLQASPDPADMKRGMEMRKQWLEAMGEAMKQGDRELNAFKLLPENSAVEQRWNRTGTYTADNPY